MDESASVKVLSRKRKKASPSSLNSNTLTGVLTRSKSRIYCHPNRSGNFRSDPVPKKPFCKTESVKTFSDVNRINASGGLAIEDLRTPRVFTPDVCSVSLKEGVESGDEKEMLMISSDAAPDSSPGLDLGVGDGKGIGLVGSRGVQLEAQKERDDSKNGLDLKDFSGKNSVSESKMALNKLGRTKLFKTPSSFSYRRLLPFLKDVLNDDVSSVSKIEIVDSGIPRKLQKLDGVASNISCNNSGDASPPESRDVAKLYEKVLLSRQNLSGAENELGKTEEVVRPAENENGLNRIDATAEEFCKMTPPELDINTKTKFETCGGSAEVNSIQAEKQDFKGPSTGSENSSKFGANSNRSVLNPCSQLRLFKNPGSVSYRRLLPFLMDISKNNTSASGAIQSPVADADLKEELQPVSSAIAEQNTENSHERLHTENGMQNSTPSMVPRQLSDDLLTGINARLVSSMPNIPSNVLPISITSEAALVPHELNDIKTEETTFQVTPRKLEPDFDRENNSSALPPSSTEDDDILNKESAPEEPESVGNQMTHSCAGFEFQNTKTDLVRKISSTQVSFQPEISDNLAAPVNGPFKGILKRNRLGCRGLCNCLSCSSFRLHADRSFEFSRNQMHDAEEVASELMKELANLRNMLEKSIINDNGLTANQLHPSQIKEACRRAIETENLVKERLSQLNYDLNIHCRTPVLLQPRVIFANYIQERTIPLLDPSSTEKDS